MLKAVQKQYIGEIATLINFLNMFRFFNLDLYIYINLTADNVLLELPVGFCERYL